MKIITPLLVLIVVAMAPSICSQEIPNGDFELWNLDNTWNNTPDFWETSNFQLSDLVNQDEASYEGEYAIKLTSGADFSVPTYARIGFPIGSIPDKLTFYAKAEVDGFPALNMSVLFYNGEDIVLGDFWSVFTSIDSWELNEIDFDNIEPVVDSVEIRIDAIAGDFAYGVGWLSIDQMEFQDFVGVEESTELEADLIIYPNPASNSITIDSKNIILEYIEVYDIMGSLVLTSPFMSNVDVSALSSGAYIVGGYSSDGAYLQRKLLIE